MEYLDAAAAASMDYAGPGWFWHRPNTPPGYDVHGPFEHERYACEDATRTLGEGQAHEFGFHDAWASIECEECQELFNN